MSFEKRVLNEVQNVFNRHTGTLVAYFEYGTLFLEDMSNEVGRDVIETLEKKFKIQYNIYNPINGFVVDFVA